MMGLEEIVWLRGRVVRTLDLRSTGRDPMQPCASC